MKIIKWERFMRIGQNNFSLYQHYNSTPNIRTLVHLAVLNFYHLYKNVKI